MQCSPGTPSAMEWSLFRMYFVQLGTWWEALSLQYNPEVGNLSRDFRLAERVAALQGPT
jgi:hypothetical protein